jgi:replicative DNA helicase
MNARANDFLLESDVTQLRIPPHSLEAEQSVLGGLLMDNYGWERVGDLLNDSDFYRHEHKLVYAAIAALVNASKPADVVTVFAQLEKTGKAAEVGGLPYLNSLAQFVLSAGNIRRYAEIVRERAILRKLIGVADEISGAAFNLQGKEVDGLLDEAMAKVMAINPEAAGDEWESMEQMVVHELDMITDRAEGNLTERPKDFIPTGLADLDDMLDGGTRGGQLIIIGARPGMGKSALADTIGLHAAKLRFPVGKFSMEMQNHEGGQRAISATARIPLHMLKRPERMSSEHWAALTKGIEDLRSLPFYSNEKGGLNINQLRAKARALRRRFGLKLLIVDYLQLMSGTDQRAPRAYQLEEASRGLKSLAKELEIPVIALVQVNRGVEKEVDQMPRMSDIKDCGGIEQDADIILMIDRPIQRKNDLDAEWKFYAKGLIVKQRGGRCGPLDFTYVGENTRFMDWPKDVPVPTSQVRVARGSSGGDL